MSASGFPGRRSDAMRAGMMTSGFIQRAKPLSMESTARHIATPSRSKAGSPSDPAWAAQIIAAGGARKLGISALSGVGQPACQPLHSAAARSGLFDGVFGMDTLEWNKIIGAILVGGLV